MDNNRIDEIESEIKAFNEKIDLKRLEVEELEHEISDYDTEIYFLKKELKNLSI